MSNVSPPQSPASQATSHSSAQGRAGAAPAQGQKASGDTRTQQEIDADNKMADRLSQIIEGANEQLLPICERMRKCIDNMFAQKEEDRDEQELVKQVKPLIEEADKILNETNGAIRGMDPEKQLTNRVKRNAQDHSASPSEQRLAEALKVLLENVQGTINWAKDKLDSFPKAKRDLGPLLDALGQPITQIVGGVGLLLTGVLNLLGNLLRGLGLDGLLKGIVGAIGLDKIYKGLGLDKWLQYGSN
ncbi:hypothetical protein Agabi119p4_4902 [Agaricus bisporus var. burnettii]|uniref:DUF6987 domain-containing protein n=1 Tax=Agaricus bisporus var. burnettii TaxID=192524 RepID=A0A8H7F468_AGABI|nr:hypothetical protein Agabi119p4_4902 [Agaricus bisporus var. burnettii]